MTEPAHEPNRPVEPRVTTIIVNWNRKAETLACLESLRKATYANLDIIVVDNGSQDGSPQAIATSFPEVRQILNPDNLKFAGGTNTGIRHALGSGAELVFILNNDTIIDPDAITQLVRHITPQTGILAPVIYYHASPERVWSAGGKTSPWNLEKNDPYRDQPAPQEWPEIIQQDFVTGCAMLFPRSTLEAVGLFDESFELYYEDSDLCRRVRQNGLEIVVAPQAKVWHKVAVSSGGSDSPDERYWMARSSIRFFRKHARGLQIPVVLFWRSASALRTSLRLASAGRWKALAAYWRGIWHGLRDKVVSQA